MGWIWSNAPKKETRLDTPFPVSDEIMKDDIPHTPLPPPNPQTAITNPKPQANLTRDELAEAELQEFLNDLKAESEPPPEPPRSRVAPRTISTEHEAPHESSINTSSISPTALYPSTMSCRQAFDEAFYCQSFGGQFNNLYRYGGTRDCSDTWSHFWFCMRTNRGYMSEQEREQAIKEHYRKRDRKYKEGPSSEDVWAMREDPVKGAFEGDWKGVLEEIRRQGREDSGVGIAGKE